MLKKNLVNESSSSIFQLDFRRGKPQYLNRKRYAEIRKLWLQHTIPIYIARQIEANYDIGGWTTL